ncbi:MAG: hypothetical protein AAB401_05155 [Acidobacteriota bacterium]
MCFRVSLSAQEGRLKTGDDSPSLEQSSTAALPELPRILLDTSYVPPSGRLINVAEGGNLQSAIDAAKPGDVIVLQPGATFIGNFILPAKFSDKTGDGEQWIVIRSAAPDSCLPQPGNRITPEYSDLLPKIISPNGGAAIGTNEGAHHYRLIGLEIGVVVEEDYNVNLVRLGDGSSLQNLLDVLPHDLIVDRCYIHGNKTGNVARGVALNSARTSIIDSYISEIHGVGFDTQAICGWNGSGPFKIANNYLEASGENIMFGGSDPSIFGLIPSDIEIRGNHLYKPLRWRIGSPEYDGMHWSVKNLLELKIVQRILIEGNVLENNWGDGQAGFGLVFKSVNQDGKAPWSVTRDVTFVNNVVRNSQAGINLLGRDTNQPGDLMRRVMIRNNLWENIADGFLQISDAPDVTVDHNTILHRGQVISTYGLQSPGFVYTNNLSAHNEYGVKGDGQGTGNSTITAYLPNSVFSRNVLAGGISSDYPSNNFFPASLNDVRFVNTTEGIYRLAVASPYRQAGMDGKDLGCDFDALSKAILKVVNNSSLSRTNPLPNQLCGKARM